MHPVRCGTVGRFRNGYRSAVSETENNQGPQIALFDQFEQLESLEPWLRKRLLPGLPAATLVVLASRQPPSLGWALHGWSSFMRVLELTELTESEAHDLLARYGVPPAEHASVVRFAGGSPMLLALAGDVSREAADFRFGASERHRVSELAAALLDGVSRESSRRDALAVSAVARFTTVELLERTLPESDARMLFTWLEQLSFVQKSLRGLEPHPLVRRSMLDELRRHHPSTYLDFERRIRTFYLHKAATADDCGTWMSDRMWLDRDVSGMSSILESNGGATQPSFVRAKAEHHPRILELVEHHEGLDSSRIAAQWLKMLPHAFEVHQGATEPVNAMLTTVEFERDTPFVARVADAVLELVLRHLHARAKLSDGESAVLFRYCLTAHAHQEPCPELNLAFAHAAKRLAERQRLAFSYCAVTSPNRWIGVARLCGLEVENLGRIRGKRADFTVLATDWRDKRFSDVFSRWVQTSASELVGRAWQLATTRPMRAAPVYRVPTEPTTAPEHGLSSREADLDDERRALEELLEERVEKLAAAAKLSPRERQVLNFILLGRHADDIAKVIEIAPRTARLHLSHLLTKLGAESRLDVFRVLS